MAASDLPDTLTIDEVIEQIQETRKKQSQIDVELEALFDNRYVLHRTLDAATFPIPEISSIREVNTKLHRKLVETSLSAHGLSSKVRELDAAQSRLSDALARVVGLLDLKTTIDKVQAYIAEEKYAEAAQDTFRILYLRPSVNNDLSFSVIIELEEKLRALIVRDCQQAQAAEDIPKVFHTARLMALVNLAYQGLSIYCQTVRQALSARLQEQQLTSKTSPANADFIKLLPKILDEADGAIRKHKQIIQESFCPGAHIRLLQIIQGECDNLLSGLLQRFIQSSQLVQRGAFATKKSRRVNSNVRGGREEDKDALDPKLVDALLEEVAYVSRETEMFDAALRVEAAKARATLQTQDSSEKAHIRASILKGLTADSLGDDLVACSKVTQIVEELLGHYVVLEEYYMIENVVKAISIDEHIGAKGFDDTLVPDDKDGPGIFSLRLSGQFQDSMTSTMVDDIFYLLKKSTVRAFSTKSASTACAIVNHINAILSRDYKEVLQTRIREYQQETEQNNPVLSRQVGGSMFGQFRNSNTKVTKWRADVLLFLTLNNLEASALNIMTLKEHLALEFEGGQSGSKPEVMISHCLAELLETSKAFTQTVKKGMSLIVALLQPRVNPLIDRLKEIDYELGEQAYAEHEFQDPFVQALIRGLDIELKPILKCFTENNCKLFLDTLLEFLVARLEGHVFKRRFTFWGGLQLDKDVRQLSTFFGQIASHSVRDKFARLVQISSILQLDKAKEILDYWGDDNEVWRLYESEVRKVLSLRVDFNAKDIKNLVF